MTDRSSFLRTRNNRTYNNDTLIGNWFENRAVKEKQPPPTQQKPEPKRSEYEENYTNAPKDDNLTDIFTSSYVESFRNRARAHHSSVKFYNAEQFLNNWATTTDIYYRILPGRDRCGKLTKEPMRAHGFDALRSFGNSTNFGLRKFIGEREAESARVPVDVSFTRNFYKCPKKGDYAKRVKGKK